MAKASARGEAARAEPGASARAETGAARKPKTGAEPQAETGAARKTKASAEPGAARKPKSSAEQAEPGAARKPKTSAEPQAEPGAARRRDLLDAAYAVIAEKGLEGLRTRDIAARAGVNISTLHYYFGTKEALLVAVVEHVIARFKERPHGGDAVQTLRAHLEEAWRTFQDHPQLWVVLQELLLRARRDPTTRLAFRAVFKEWNRIVEGLVRAGVQAGRLRADLDPRACAAAMTSLVIGAMTQLEIDARSVDYRDLVRELDGWLAPPPGKRASRRA